MPAAAILAPVAMILQCLVECKAKIAFLLGSGRLVFLVGVGNLLRRLQRLVPFLPPRAQRLAADREDLERGALAVTG